MLFGSRPAASAHRDIDAPSVAFLDSSAMVISEGKPSCISIPHKLVESGCVAQMDKKNDDLPMQITTQKSTHHPSTTTPSRWLARIAGGKGGKSTKRAVMVKVAGVKRSMPGSVAICLHLRNRQKKETGGMTQDQAAVLDSGIPGKHDADDCFSHRVSNSTTGTSPLQDWLIKTAYRVSPVHSVRGNRPLACHFLTACPLTPQALATAERPTESIARWIGSCISDMQAA